MDIKEVDDSRVDHSQENANRAGNQKGGEYITPIANTNNCHYIHSNGRRCRKRDINAARDQDKENANGQDTQEGIALQQVK